MNMNELENKSIIILGLGREGLSTYSFLRRHFPDKQIALADKSEWSQLNYTLKDFIESDKKVTLFLGSDYLKSVSKYDIVFKSPGIYPFLPELSIINKSNKTIISNTELFFEICKGTVIGITGTKGKSTTTSIIFKMLKKGGYDVRLAGNFGVPPLSALDGTTSKTIFVTELSSYQLMSLKKSPHIAILLNIFKEHIDYHQTFKAYVESKKNITRYQSEKDYFIYNSSSTLLSEIAIDSKAKKVSFGFKKVGNVGCYFCNGSLVYYSNGKHEDMISVDQVTLKGIFNLQNVMPAILLGKLYNISSENIRDTIQDYKPLEHRIEFVSKLNEVSFYNDSIATIPEATIAAINAFPEEHIILLAGGFDRGQDFRALAKIIITNNVNPVILFPTTGNRLWEDICCYSKLAHNLPVHIFVTTMQEGVKKAYDFAKKDSIVLLSPGSASFNSFKDYADRGLCFKEEIKRLKDRLKIN